MGYLIPIAVIDSSMLGLFIYDIDSDWDNETVEQFLHTQGRKPSNCSWGVFDGEITDLRDDSNTHEFNNTIRRDVESLAKREADNFFHNDILDSLEDENDIEFLGI